MAISIIPFFGGKHKMSAFLVSLLDYSKNSYAEVFGGGCRTLLNTPPFIKDEYYVEYSPYLCSLIRVLANKTMAMEFIQVLNDIDYSEENFNKYYRIKKEFENDLPQVIYNNMSNYLQKIDGKYKTKLRYYFEDSFVNIIQGYTDKHKIYFNNKLNLINQEEKDELSFYNSQMSTCLRVFLNTNEPENIMQENINVEYKTEFEKSWHKVKNNSMLQSTYINEELERWSSRYSLKYNVSKEELISNVDYKKRYKEYKRKLILRECINVFVKGIEWHDYIDITDIELATTAYVVFRMSRGGMGKCFSVGRNDADFRRSILNLDKAIQRLQGVEVIESDAFTVLNLWKYQNRSDLMVFLDPPYLPQEKEIEDNKDIKLEESLPGDFYDVVWTRKTHENFLKLIQNVPFSALVCNYTDSENLYDRYLTKDNGWTKVVYQTVTTVSDKKDNFREECVWMNY